MTTGNYSVFIDGFNRSEKSWNGPNGKDNENPYSMYWIILKAGMSQHIWGHWDYTYPPWAGASDLPNATNEALQCFANLADAIRGHEFDTGVALAQSKQTADLVTNNAKKVFAAYRAVKRGDFGGMWRALGKTQPPKAPTRSSGKPLTTRDIADNWLEAQYGWLPLLSDIEEGLKAYHSERDSQQFIYRAKKTTRGTQLGDQLGHMAETTLTVKLKGILTETSRPTFAVINPVTIAWEVLPWSFVVDWFIPIGDYLAAASFFSAVDLRVMQSIFKKTRFVVKKLNPPPPWQFGWRDYTTIGLERNWISNPSIPPPKFKSLEKSLSLPHLQNAAALIRGLVKDAKR